MTVGCVELVLQTADGPRFVADCRANPFALVGHVKSILGPEAIKLSCGGLLAGNVRLKIVPLLWLPPESVAPYKMLFTNSNDDGWVGSFPTARVCKVLKPVPSVLTANTVPPQMPPCAVVPYRVFPDRTNSAYGKAPSVP